MRISDWSSDVCSSDLKAKRHSLAGTLLEQGIRQQLGTLGRLQIRHVHARCGFIPHARNFLLHKRLRQLDRIGLQQLVKRLRLETVAHRDRKSTRLNFQSLMRISYAVFCLTKKNNN